MSISREQRRAEALRAAFNDEELADLDTAIAECLIAKRAAMRDANKAGHALTEDAFGIPAMMALRVRVNAALETEPVGG